MNFHSNLLKSIIETSFTLRKSQILINLDNSDQCQAPYQRDFDYSSQSSWDCACSTGSFQSPIPLVSSQALVDSQASLSMKYSKSSKDPIAIHKNHREIELFGSFGDLSYKNPDKDPQIFASYKISFKFPSEHTINTRQYPLEIIVHHKSQETLEEATLSILVKEDSKGESDLNKFLVNIDSETWSFEEPVTILSKPNLKLLLSENNEKNGFFSYMGSETSPPCNENIEKFVMKKAIKVPISQILALKKRSVKGNNARIIKDNMKKNEKILVYFNKGKKAFVKDRETAEEIAKEVTERINRNKRRLSPEKFIRISSNTSDYIVKN